MNWDRTYQADRLVWGEKPGELVNLACKYLGGVNASGKVIETLDLGCGYGRDTLFLVRNIRCRILGVDNSREAIAMARKRIGKAEHQVRFRCCDFRQMPSRKFDVIYASNLYQLLRKEDRKALQEVIRKALKGDGMLFLSTLSINDPEHFQKGEKVRDEENSFQDEKFLHFCTREELERDFGFLTIKELYEHEYYEPHFNGETHHHISWLLLGINQ
jgi:SAM-dependent methyltransferase